MNQFYKLHFKYCKCRLTSTEKINAELECFTNCKMKSAVVLVISLLA